MQLQQLIRVMILLIWKHIWFSDFRRDVKYINSMINVLLVNNLCAGSYHPFDGLLSVCSKYSPSFNQHICVHPQVKSFDIDL